MVSFPWWRFCWLMVQTSKLFLTWKFSSTVIALWQGTSHLLPNPGLLPTMEEWWSLFPTMGLQRKLLWASPCQPMYQALDQGQTKINSSLQPATPFYYLLPVNLIPTSYAIGVPPLLHQPAASCVVLHQPKHWNIWLINASLLPPTSQVIAPHRWNRG